MYKSQFFKKYPYDWFCGPDHIIYFLIWYILKKYIYVFIANIYSNFCFIYNFTLQKYFLQYVFWVNNAESWCYWEQWKLVWQKRFQASKLLLVSENRSKLTSAFKRLEMRSVEITQIIVNFLTILYSPRLSLYR